MLSRAAGARRALALCVAALAAAPLPTRATTPPADAPRAAPSNSTPPADSFGPTLAPATTDATATDASAPPSARSTTSFAPDASSKTKWDAGTVLGFVLAAGCVVVLAVIVRARLRSKPEPPGVELDTVLVVTPPNAIPPQHFPGQQPVDNPTPAIPTPPATRPDAGSSAVAAAAGADFHDEESDFEVFDLGNMPRSKYNQAVGAPGAKPHGARSAGGGGARYDSVSSAQITHAEAVVGAGGTGAGVGDSSAGQGAARARARAGAGGPDYEEAHTLLDLTYQPSRPQSAGSVDSANSGYSTTTGATHLYGNPRNNAQHAGANVGGSGSGRQDRVCSTGSETPEAVTRSGSDGSYEFPVDPEDGPAARNSSQAASPVGR